jgi:hypothetical protein
MQDLITVMVKESVRGVKKMVTVVAKRNSNCTGANAINISGLLV